MQEAFPLAGRRQPAVLFISRRNSLRSVLAHACLEHIARGRCRAMSCGVPQEIADAAHPAGLAALAQAGVPPAVHAPRSWSFLRASGARPDVVILLDPLQDHDPPSWPGQPSTALWRYPDLALESPEVVAAQSTILLHSLRRRVEILVTLLTRASEGTALRSDIRDIAFL